MALVVPPPAGIPNALNPTTAAVQRDTEKREITPAITPDSASASTGDAAENRDKVNYKSAKENSAKKKAKKRNQLKNTVNKGVNTVDDVTTIADAVSDQSNVEFSFAVDATPETIIAQVLALKQRLLEKTMLSDDDRWQLSEINHVTRTALADLTRLKYLDEVKAVAAERPKTSVVIKRDAATDVSRPVALDDLFACSFSDNTGQATVSAKSKLAGAVVGQFYEDNIEPQIPPKIDHQE